MKLLSIIVLGLLVTGCAGQSQYLIKKEFVPLDIKKSEYPCPYTPESELPSGPITDATLLQLWAEARRDNAICHNSMHSLYKTIDTANEKVINATK